MGNDKLSKFQKVIERDLIQKNSLCGLCVHVRVNGSKSGPKLYLRLNTLSQLGFKDQPEFPGLPWAATECYQTILSEAKGSRWAAK